MIRVRHCVCLVEMASTQSSTGCNWKVREAEEVKPLGWRRAQVSVHRAGFALQLWERASEHILCSNDGGMKNARQSKCLNLWTTL